MSERGSGLSLAALLAGALTVGSAPIFVRLSELGPSATAFYRLLLALPVLFAWSQLAPAERPRRRPRPGDALLLVVAGLCFAGDLVAWHWSIKLTPVANATLFANCAPLFVVLVAWVFLGERMTARFLAGLAVTLAGAVVVVGATLEVTPTAVLGDALGLVTAAFFAGYLLVIKWLRVSLSAGAIMAWSGVVTSVALLAVAVISGEALLAETVAGWAVLAGLALLAHCGGQGLIAWSVARLPVTFSSIALLLETVSAALLAWLVLAEALSAWQAAGGVVVLLGILLASRTMTTAPPARADSGPPR